MTDDRTQGNTQQKGADVAQVKKLDIALIRLDKLVQMRALGEEEHVDGATVAEYLEAMESGSSFPPIVAFYDGEDYWLADGFHRLEAYQRLGKQKVDVEVYNGTKREAQLYAMQANLKHGLRATRADKQKAVLVLLQDEEWSKWSQEEIARRAGVAPTTVTNIRKRYGIEASAEKTYTKNGRVLSMKTDTIGKRQPEHKTKPDALQNGELPELDAKEKRKAEEFALRYGVSLELATYYQQAAKTKRQQDSIDRAQRQEQARLLKQKKVRALRRKAKALTTQELKALELARIVAQKLEADVDEVLAVL